jgi:hypothetical protein
VGALHGVCGSHAAELAGVGDKLDAGYGGEQALIFWNKADSLADIEPARANVHAENFARAGIYGDESEKGSDESGLSRAVRPEQAHSARRRIHRQLPKGGDLSVRLCNGLQTKQHQYSWRDSDLASAEYFLRYSMEDDEAFEK